LGFGVGVLLGEDFVNLDVLWGGILEEHRKFHKEKEVANCLKQREEVSHVF